MHIKLKPNKVLQWLFIFYCLVKVAWLGQHGEKSICLGGSWFHRVSMGNMSSRQAGRHDTWSGLESVVIVVWSLAAGMAVAESLYFETTIRKGDTEELGIVWVLTSKSTHKWHIYSTRTHPIVIAKQLHHWGWNIQIWTYWATLIQTTKPLSSSFPCFLSLYLVKQHSFSSLIFHWTNINEPPLNVSIPTDA